jgi:hypothetical protein
VAALDTRVVAIATSFPIHPQVKSLKTTVKEANGIIIKSEALKEEYRLKVMQLQRELEETQVMACRVRLCREKAKGEGG